MNGNILAGLQILIVEDEYYLADEAREILSQMGAAILGPVPTVEQAHAMIIDTEKIDAALLDVNLRGELVFELADTLKERGVPFAFATGYDRDVLPDRFADRPVFGKPVRPDSLLEAFSELVGRSATDSPVMSGPAI